MRKIMAKKAQERGNDGDQNAPTAGQRRLEREQAEREVSLSDKERERERERERNRQ
jgi:hypothetical protein